MSPGANVLPTQLHRDYGAIRSATLALCAPLTVEDHVVQTMADVSPPKWHLAHTTWFFETFVLGEFLPSYRPVQPQYRKLFNSYYVSVGAPYPRHERGLLSRPTLAEVLEYRRLVDAGLLEFLDTAVAADNPEVQRRIVLGLQHEQQHQELLLMDIKHIFASNFPQPLYQRGASRPRAAAPAARWLEHEGGLHEFGHSGSGFAYDNESPRHRAFLLPFALASRLTTNGEYLAFIQDRGYARPDLWLADGWNTAASQGWQAPLYWLQEDGLWYEFTLAGRRPLDLDEPVVHLSFFEAEAFARWRGARLPSEYEWELAARSLPVAGNFAEEALFHPRPAAAEGLAQMFGDVWEPTRSDYAPYPGYRAPAGALGEYNGKFMSGQIVLRGGSCVTPRSHVRATYRNFFYLQQRWSFQGVRLARNLEG